MIRDLWTQETDSIHSMHVVNTYAISYQSKTPEKCLEKTDRKKKTKYLHSYPTEHQNFTPSIDSVDSLIGVKVEATFKHIASRLAQN